MAFNQPADDVNWSKLKEEHDEIENELDNFEEIHKSYLISVQKAKSLQQKLSESIGKKSKRLNEFRKLIRKRETHTDIETDIKFDIDQKIEFRNNQLLRFKDTLPKKGELYLRIILGSLNVNLIEKDVRLKYKEEYETFKLILNVIIFFLSLITFTVNYYYDFNYKALDAALQFLLVWYHCTLTIRESILIANGSRIHGWWRALQFITTIQAGIIILWPDGPSYNEFRFNFLLYTLYTAFLQYLQFKYQHDCLYRLRALGDCFDMDVTIQGFHSWMWRGLTFLLPFLIFGYIFQAYNALTLYWIYGRPETHEWQVILTSFIYFTISLGNFCTIAWTVYHRIRKGFSDKLRAFDQHVIKID